VRREQGELSLKQPGLIFRWCHVALLLSGIAGGACASSRADGGCSALCVRKVTFQFTNPPTGSVFQIALRPGNTSVTCTADSAGETMCDPTISQITHVDIATRRLQSVTWQEPPSGALRIQVTTDGVLLVDQSFDYEPKAVPGPCATCYEDPQFVVD
jgi:hypothetical protein